MTCHLRVFLISIGILLGTSSVFATTSFTSITGATAQSTTTTTQFYYSNITSTIFTDPTTTVQYYVGSTTANGACNTNLNPTCLTSNSVFTLSGSTTNTSGSLYLLVLTATPNVGDAISNTTEVVAPIAATSGTFTPTFANICQAYMNATGATAGNLAASQYLDANCIDQGPYQATPVDPEQQNVQIYIVSDSGTPGEVTDFAQIQLTFVSAIQAVAIPNTAGFDPFSMFPGDQKAYITNVSEQSGFPGTINNNVGSARVRFYYTTGTTYDASTAASIFATVVPGTAAFYDDTVDSTATLGSQYVPNLTNNLTYYFRAAVVDLAGNVGYLTTDDSQARVVTPDAVVGLLAENSSCFIATAAFGTTMAPQVNILRQFRDQILMKTPRGQSFVNWYYRHSPKWAYRIQNSPNARFAVRTALYPLIGFSYLSLKFGAKNACMLFATFLLMPFLFVRWRRSIKTLNSSSCDL